MNIDETIFLAKQRKTLWDTLTQEIKNFSFLNEQSKYGVRVGVAVAIATYLAWVIQLPDVYWASMSAFIASQGTLGSTISKAFMRLLGTVLGGIAGFICAVFFSQNLVLFIMFAIGICVVPFYFREIDQKFNYTWILSAVTAIIVMFSMVSASVPDQDTAFTTLVNRTMEVCLGVIVSAICAYVVFPNLSARIARKKLIKIYANWGDMLQKIFDKYNGIDNHDDFLKLYLQQANEINQLFNLLQAVEYERKLWHIQLPYEALERFARELDEIFIYSYERLSGSKNTTDFSALVEDLKKIFNFISDQFDKKSLIFTSDEMGKVHQTISHYQARLNKNVKDDLAASRMLLFISKSLTRFQKFSTTTERKTTDIISHFKQVIFYEGFTKFDIRNIKNAVFTSIMVVLVPLFWVSIGSQQAVQICITVFVCMTLKTSSTKSKVIQRLSGCAAGSVVTLFFLSFSIESAYTMCLVLFISMYFFQYLFAGDAKCSYFGMQACIPITMGLVYGLEPMVSVLPALERLTGIFIGVISVILIEAIVNTETPFTQIKHNVYQTRKSLVRALKLLCSQGQLKSEMTTYNLWRMRLCILDLRSVKTEDKRLKELDQSAIACIRSIYHCIYHIHLYYRDEPYRARNEYIASLSEIISLLSMYELSISELLDNAKESKKLYEKVHQTSLKYPDSYKTEVLARIAKHTSEYFYTMYTIRNYEQKYKYR